MSGLQVTPRCKHGIKLTEQPCEMCKSIWGRSMFEPPTQDETDELEKFFRKGIETIQGQRGRIKELEKRVERVLNQSPMVTCGSCENPMSTVSARKRMADFPFENVELDEVRYICANGCNTVVWVAKLKGMV